MDEFHEVMLHTKLKALGLVVSGKKIFLCSPYISLCKICDYRGGANFDPMGHYLNKLSIGPLGDATHQISRL